MRADMQAQRGFTLVEMLTVVSLFAILAALAGPNFALFLETQRARSAAFDLVSDLLLARSEAAKRAGAGAVVQMTPQDGGWANGWTVSLVSDGTVLSERNGISSQLVFSDAVPESISFDRDGRVITAADVRFNVRGPSQSEAEGSCIELDATGRARSQRGACS